MISRKNFCTFHWDTMQNDLTDEKLSSSEGNPDPVGSFCALRRLKSAKWTKFRAHKMAKTARLQLLDSPNEICEIWVIENTWNSKTVKLDQNLPKLISHKILETQTVTPEISTVKLDQNHKNRFHVKSVWQKNPEISTMN